MARKRVELADQWQKLWQLIIDYGNACRTHEMRGGGDPRDTLIIDQELKLATDRLTLQIERMKEDV